MLIDLLNSKTDKNTSVYSVNGNYIRMNSNTKCNAGNKKMVGSNSDFLNYGGKHSICNCNDNNPFSKFGNETLGSLDVRYTNDNMKAVELNTHLPLAKIEGREFLNDLEPIPTPFPKAFNSLVSPIYEEYIQPNNDIPFK